MNAPTSPCVRPRSTHLLLPFLLLPLTTASCVSAGRLGEYDFRDRTLKVVNVAPPPPVIDTGDDMELDPDDWGRTAARVGASVFKEGMAMGARARLDTASRNVDAGARMAERLLTLSARELRAVPVETAEKADFEIDLRVGEYGIEADDWDSQARFYLHARVRLLDGESGAEIWSKDVDESQALSDYAWGVSPDGPFSSVITGSTLATLSRADMERILAGLADYAADEVAESLRKGLEKARAS